MNDLYIGLLSGTSIDAVDVAAINFNHSKPQFVAKLNYPIPIEFKNTCQQITETGQCHVDMIGELDNWAGELFANAVLELLTAHNIPANAVNAIGSHGQTIRHIPSGDRPFTWQIGDPNLISQKTGITTVADFRRRDMAAGGQGAPLAPAFHHAVFQSQEEHRVIANIGGITNVSILSPDPSIRILGFDTGPGNCLLDYWAQSKFQVNYDHNGQIAARGNVHPSLLKACLADPYFDKAPPKSTGREYFTASWLKKNMRFVNHAYLTPADVQATLLELTAETLINAIQAHAPATTNIYLCGGGAENGELRKAIQALCSYQISTTESLGIPPCWVEAALFAWLAKQTLEGKPANIPEVTGASTPVPLGGIYGFIKNRQAEPLES